jgi:hypothetical protein
MFCAAGRLRRRTGGRGRHAERAPQAGRKAGAAGRLHRRPSLGAPPAGEPSPAARRCRTRSTACPSTCAARSRRSSRPGEGAVGGGKGVGSKQEERCAAAARRSTSLGGALWLRAAWRGVRPAHPRQQRPPDVCDEQLHADRLQLGALVGARGKHDHEHLMGESGRGPQGRVGVRPWRTQRAGQGVLVEAQGNAQAASAGTHLADNDLEVHAGLETGVGGWGQGAKARPLVRAQLARPWEALAACDGNPGRHSRRPWKKRPPTGLTEGVASTLRVMGLSSQSPTDCGRRAGRGAGRGRLVPAGGRSTHAHPAAARSAPRPPPHHGQHREAQHQHHHDGEHHVCEVRHGEALVAEQQVHDARGGP